MAFISCTHQVAAKPPVTPKPAPKPKDIPTVVYDDLDVDFICVKGFRFEPDERGYMGWVPDKDGKPMRCDDGTE